MDIFYKNKYIKKLLKYEQLPDDLTIVNNKFTNLLHLWYAENQIWHEFIHKMNSFGCKILHEIVIWYKERGTDQTAFVVAHNYGYDEFEGSEKKHYTSYLNFEQYYLTQISTCCEEIAIPICLYFDGDKSAHCNMLYIKRKRNKACKLIVEYFEPYGKHTMYNVLNEINYLICNLFAYEIEDQNDIQIIDTSHCHSIQYLITFGVWKESCVVICMWYAINRFISTNEDHMITCQKMEQYLLKNSPVSTIRSIILAFLQFVTIDENGTINCKKTISKNILDKINCE